MPAQIDSHYIRTRPTRLWARLVSYALFEGRPLTTKGQWLNPLVFGLYRLWCIFPQLKVVKQPIFILGAGRSGTTILGVLLSMHRHVGFLNEPKAMWHTAFGGGEDLIGSFDRGEARYRLDQDDVLPSCAQTMRKIYGAYLRVTGSSRVVDKYPELIFRLPFVKHIFPDAKFLFIARNGWDTCGSIKGWSERLGEEKDGEVHDWWGADDRKWKLLVEQIVPEHTDLAPHAVEMMTWADQEQRAIVEWIVTMREGHALAEAYPDSVLHIPYEEMCAHPRDWMTKIVSFVELSNDDVFSSYACEKLFDVPEKDSFALFECLEKPFAQTMTLLGYQESNK